MSELSAPGQTPLMSLRQLINPPALAASGLLVAGLALSGASAVLALPAGLFAAAVASPLLTYSVALEGDEVVQYRGRRVLRRLPLCEISSLEAQPAGPEGRTWFVSDGSRRIRIQSGVVAELVLDRLGVTLSSKQYSLNSFARAYLSDRGRTRR